MKIMKMKFKKCPFWLSSAASLLMLILFILTVVSSASYSWAQIVKVTPKPTEGVLRGGTLSGKLIAKTNRPLSPKKTDPEGGKFPKTLSDLRAIISLVVVFFLGKMYDELYAKFKEVVWGAVTRHKFGVDMEKINAKPEFSQILPIDRGVPYYEFDHICVNMGSDVFFLSIPAEIQSQLTELRFKSRSQRIFGESDDLNLLDSMSSISGLSRMVESEKKIVAIEILGELKRGGTRFNGEMFAIRSVRGNRTDDEEKSTFDMEFHKTDYFTYRVMGKVYRNLAKGGFDFNFSSSFESINKYPMFTNSFGVVCFVMIDISREDWILMCRRSINLEVNPGKWHFSMNEAFSTKDFANQQTFENPSLETCLFRGLDEELGLKRADISPGHCHYTDIVMALSRCEPGAMAYARMKVGSRKNLDDFIAKRAIAQDANLEIQEYRFIKVKEIPEFVEKNRADISEGCLWGLSVFKTRYDVGYIKRNAR